MVLINTDDVIESLLPEDALGEIPTGYSIVGHVGTKSSKSSKI